MREPITSAFPMARCEPCGKTVLTYITLADSGDERRLCVHCDTPITGALEWISAEELEAGGYYIGQPPVRNGCGGGGGECAFCSTRKN